MSDPSIADHKRHIKKTIRSLEKKIENPEFIEKLSNEGHLIAREFLDEVRWGLNVMAKELGRTNQDYIEFSEAVAMIGSGCIRWACSRTMILMRSSDFRRNKHIVNMEKHKIERCYELINVFSNMVIHDPAINSVVIDVKQMVYEINNKLNRRSGCYIATVAYASPNAKEVIRFKEYRDQILKKTIIGKFFLSLYYLISPPLSNFLVNKAWINKLLKQVFLDPIYRRLKK